jgi:DNA-directed RNA polymerase I, II, and III subunit RPABC2
MSDIEYYSSDSDDSSENESVQINSNKSKKSINKNTIDEYDDDVESSDNNEEFENEESDNEIKIGGDSEVEEEIKEDDTDIDEDINNDSDDEMDDEEEDIQKESEKNKKKSKNSKGLNNPQQLNNLVINNYDDEDDEDDDYDENYLKKFDEEIKKNYINEYHPECFIHNYEEISALTKVVKNSDNIIIDPLHKTIPFLTKFEKARILGQRSKQIESGSKPFIRVPENVIDSYIIAELELQQKRIPFIIRRPLPNGGCEYWNLRDLEIISF